MKKYLKFIPSLLLLSFPSSANEVFNGLTQTEHFEFNIFDIENTEDGGGAYVINKCTPKATDDIDAVYTLVIPSKVNNKLVRIAEKAFDWYECSGENYNYSVNLVFEKTDDAYIKFPSSCEKLFFETNALEGGSEIRTKVISIDFSGADTSDVTNMLCMFYGCFGLTELDLSNFDTRNVTNMFQMFHGCYNLKRVNLSSFDTNQVTDLSFMFCNCVGLEDVIFPEHFDTTNATKMVCMFCNCSELQSITISPNFVIGSGEVDVNAMFAGCQNDLNVVGNTAWYGFAQAGSETSSKITQNADANVYTVAKDHGISDSLVQVVSVQLPSATFNKNLQLDCSNLFSILPDDVAYIGLAATDQTIVVNGLNNTISAKMVNKTVDSIGYYPANLRLTGSITLSGDNSGFNQKSFTIGDEINDTTVTLIAPKALPQTDLTVEKGGTLVLAGTENYSLHDNITIKSSGKLNASKRLILPNGVMLILVA